MKLVTFVWLFCSLVLVLAGNERNDSAPPEDPKPIVESTIQGAVAVAAPIAVAAVAAPAPVHHHGNRLRKLRIIQIVCCYVVLVARAIRLSDSMQKNADVLATFQHPELLKFDFGVYDAALYGLAALASSLVLHPMGSLTQFIAIALSSAELARLYRGYAPVNNTEASVFLATTAQTTVFLHMAVFACYLIMLIRKWLS